MTGAKIIASSFGIGYLQKGAGTVAALFCCLFWYATGIAAFPWWAQLLTITVFFFVGMAAATEVENEWGHDSNRVVIDEVQGMMTALFLLPFDWHYFLAAFVLFRFFDILKPFGIRRMEAVKGGWGVMLDDLLAGIVSNVLLHLVITSHLIS
jgi:phosphatidylglycerophosphatase A